MRFLCIVLVFASILFLSGCSHHEPDENIDVRRHGAMSSENVLRHVVLFKFKDDATAQQIKNVENAFRALPQKIDVIKDLEWGTNVSPENLSKGYTHCFFLSFENEAGRDTYLPHPAHKEFSSILRPVVDKVLVVDYLAKK